MVAAEKFQAYGNDFLMVAGGDVPEEKHTEFARAICRAHFGVGADGCIFLNSLAPETYRLRFFNLDGSEAGMSGNGARCAAAFIHRRGLTSAETIRFQTLSGEKVYRLLEARPPVWRYVSSMGPPVFAPQAIPFLSPEGNERVEDYALRLGDLPLCITALSVGNPQCVVFVEKLPVSPDFEKIGGALEKHPFFPERTNVSFVKVLNLHQVRVKFWERGVGHTYSSGTGSSGAAVAAILTNRAETPVEVLTETGRQQVEWVPSQDILLTGEARFVAEILYQWQENENNPEQPVASLK